MVYQLSTLVDEVIDLAKDSSLPRTRISNYIQRTQDRILGRHRFRFSEKPGSLSLVTGDVVKDLPTGLQVILDAYLMGMVQTPPYRLSYVPQADFFADYPTPDLQPQGLPRFYTVFGNQIYLSCPMSKTATLAYRYQAAPTKLTADTSVPDIPEEFSDVLIKGALARVEAYRENFDISKLYERDVEDLEDDLLARYGLRVLKPGKARAPGARPRG